MFANTPKPPYYAVIFTSIRTEISSGYKEMTEEMLALARKQDGFLGEESARAELGITVSYWKDLKSIKNWKMHLAHQKAQDMGRSHWYAAYKTRISLVERDYFFENE